VSASPASENLSLVLNQPAGHGIAGTLLRLQVWLDARTSARALYRIDDRGLSDLALSRSDVERVNATVQWPTWRQ